MYGLSAFSFFNLSLGKVSSLSNLPQKLNLRSELSFSQLHTLKSQISNLNSYFSQLSTDSQLRLNSFHSGSLVPFILSLSRTSFPQAVSSERERLNKNLKQAGCLLPLTFDFKLATLLTYLLLLGYSRLSCEVKNEETNTMKMKKREKRFKNKNSLACQSRSRSRF